MQPNDFPSLEAWEQLPMQPAQANTDSVVGEMPQLSPDPHPANLFPAKLYPMVVRISSVIRRFLV